MGGFSSVLFFLGLGEGTVTLSVPITGVSGVGYVGYVSVWGIIDESQTAGWNDVDSSETDDWTDVISN